MKPSKQYFQPAAALGASHLLKRQAPQLVGRLPKPRRASVQMALALAKKHLPQAPGVKPMGGNVKANKKAAEPLPPPVPRQGGALSLKPPAGDELPKQLSGGLVKKASPLAGSPPLKLPRAPKL